MHIIRIVSSSTYVTSNDSDERIMDWKGWGCDHGLIKVLM